MQHDQSFKAVVVGAGPGGLVALKELLEAGIRNVCLLEKSDRIGGLFAGSYDGLYLTSSAAFSMFSDFPIQQGTASTFWTKQQVADYWTAYATEFDLWPHIRFDTKVNTASRAPGGGWELATEGGPVTAEHLIVATGNNVAPVVPDWAADVTAIPALHSSQYRNPEAFKDKTVVIVGGGESGADITLEIAAVAKRTVVSLRNGPGWIVPRKRGEIAADISTHRAFWTLPYWTGQRISNDLIEADRERGKKSDVLAEVARLNGMVASPHGIRGVFGTKSLGLPRAIVEHGATLTDGIAEVKEEGRVLVTHSGERLDNVDMILFATGFRTDVPFLADTLPQFDPREWFKGIFVPDLGDALALVGFSRPTFGSQFPVMELQSRFVAQVLSGQATLPSRAHMASVASTDSARLSDQFGATGDRVRGLVDYARYMNDLARIIGCHPRLWRLALTSPRMWVKVMFGPMQGAQFRLTGPGSKPETAKAILRDMPHSPFNHIVKAGLRARLRLLMRMGRRPRA